jgi:hypothetical protein
LKAAEPTRYSYTSVVDRLYRRVFATERVGTVEQDAVDRVSARYELKAGLPRDRREFSSDSVSARNEPKGGLPGLPLDREKVACAGV